jgi:hypothetical protein
MKLFKQHVCSSDLILKHIALYCEIDADLEAKKKFESEYNPEYLESVYELLITLGYSYEDVTYATGFEIESIKAFQFQTSIVQLVKGGKASPSELCKGSFYLAKKINELVRNDLWESYTFNYPHL